MLQHTLGTKATPVGDIPADMLKSTTDIHLLFLTKIINYSFENSCFPDKQKLAELSPIIKKNDDLDEENDRPMSILSQVSKVFERIMYMQIHTFKRGKLSKLLTGIRTYHSNQHCLMSMLEMWKNTVDKGNFFFFIFFLLFLWTIQRLLTH